MNIDFNEISDAIAHASWSLYGMDNPDRWDFDEIAECVGLLDDLRDVFKDFERMTEKAIEYNNRVFERKDEHTHLNSCNNDGCTSCKVRKRGDKKFREEKYKRWLETKEMKKHLDEGLPEFAFCPICHGEVFVYKNYNEDKIRMLCNKCQKGWFVELLDKKKEEEAK